MGNHWYDREGTPTYQVKAKNGELRDTTLRDARKLGLVPSVTTITGVQEKAWLHRWKQEQLFEALFNDPFKPGKHNPAVWKSSVLYEADTISRESSLKGNIMHKALEQAILGNPLDKATEAFVMPVLEFLNQEFPEVSWITEESFTSVEYGFGGQVDLHSKYHNIVLDFKTKNTSDLKKMVANDDYHMQTAAYAVGLKLDISVVRRYNLFISTETPGLMELTESTDFERDWGMFRHLTKFWQLCHRYVPYNGGV